MCYFYTTNLTRTMSGKYSRREILRLMGLTMGGVLIPRQAWTTGEAVYPLNMYSEPEVAQIGKTEAQLQEEGVDYMVSEFPLSANGKAMTEGSTEGFVRILSEKKYGQVLGVQIVSHNATDMIAEAAAFLTIEATVYDVAQTIHAHPTISEVFMEAGFAAVDKAIHI